ncbi:hypothetical protein TcarDRAFT_2049 [Thermosinus carboxydivorans Nor1]|uniref:G domain-containing protein n=1 Tax=Thermosinus carboxydivorans Nor1 TaxID=401526 RepID=A1HMU4_9FIRM|nr:GTPase [Thermosinus carboxydivorans]EAX48577.1 hypothetical protein TcarDRAFT_2049 [Thermosinus carboxydivorans Nor1]
MRECAVVGRPNSGKTMFALNFAAFLGSKAVDITFRTYDGLLTCRHFIIEEARRELCSLTAHKTRSIQSMILKMPVGKATVNFKLTDTCGITEHIHADENIRRGMAQTIGLMRTADFIFHIIDAADFPGEVIASKDNNIDWEIYTYGTARGNYVLLANKIDLIIAKNNLPKLKGYFPEALIIPISALYSQGFKEVKAYVARNL